MAMLAMLIVWSAAGVGGAFAFECCYPVWRAWHDGVLSKATLARAYWCVVCAVAFIGASPLAPLMLIPMAVSHTDLAKTMPDSIAMSTVLKHIPDVMRRLIRNGRL